MLDQPLVYPGAGPVPSRMAALKKCSKCGEKKAISLFSRDRTKKGGRSHWCRSCKGKVSGKWAKDHREERNRYYRERYDAKEAHAYYIRWKESNPGVLRRQLLARHGTTERGYLEMLSTQGGRCAICRKKRPGRGKKVFDVDHDHLTGKIRGLLCSRCNTGIGLLLDDPLVCLSAFEYLMQSQPSPWSPS